MKITMNLKDRPTFIFAGASMLAAAAMLWILFLPALRNAGQAVTRSALSLKKAQELALSKDSIESKTARIRSTASGDDWVKRLTDASKRQGVVFDTMLPDDPGSEFPGETGVRVGFRSDIGRFSAFVHSLAMEDALCLIREMKLEKGEGGILNCELVLSRVAA
jgi:hypothetical protein